jgi:hypothetical protein
MDVPDSNPITLHEVTGSAYVTVTRARKTLWLLLNQTDVHSG